MKLMLRFVFIASLLVSNFVCAANSQQELREFYQKWTSSYQSLNFDDQQTLLNSLKDYPLYPYAEVQFLQNNLKIASVQMVSNFVKNNSDFPLTSSLSQSYLAELTNRQDWDAILAFPRDNSIASSCRYQFALLQQGNKEQALEPIQALWLTGKELPSACDPLLDAWEQSGQRTNNLILLRIELVVQQNNLKLARYLTNQLPDDYKTTKTNLLALFDNSRKLGDFSKNIKASSFTKKIILASFPRLAKADTNLAEKLLPILVKQQNLTTEDEALLQRSLANRYFNDSVTDEQITWRDDIIRKSHDTGLVEKRIRLAIDENNYTDIAYWLTQLTPEDQLKEEWQYWQARVLLKNNKDNDAQTILKTISANRGFYGMISAQTLNQPYKLNNQSQTVSKSELTSLKNKYDNRAFVKRINELRHWGMLTESSREWRYYLTNMTNNTEYLALAKYAYQQGWGELSIQATISGKLWNNWTERLPIMYKDFYKEALTDKTIPLSYALAITRQESAFDATVQSPVGASGLMQLMPATAKDTAKKLGSLPYYSVNQLFDPRTNIQLGTYYLNLVYQQNDSNRILASAAYNAGPHRVKRWLKESDGKLDAIAFIESIPFTETRNYVKSVLVYDYIYQTILKNKTEGILKQNELNRQY